MKSTIKYLKYLFWHKYYVGCACFKMGLYYQGIVHDLSKFRFDEFIEYKNFFYGDGKTFDISRNHHQKRNQHHRQYWILYNDDGSQTVLEMPEKYVKEMLCDWWGVGKVFNQNVPAYLNYKLDYWREVKKRYGNNKQKILIHQNTREYIEKFLYNIICKK